MGNSEYLHRQLDVDVETMGTMSLDNADFGELTTDPSTWIVASKNRSDSPSADGPKLQSPYSHCRTKAITSSNELQRQVSVSNMSSPDLDDGYSTGSWTASEESLVDYAVDTGASPRVPYYDDWNSWFPPERASQQTLPLRGSSLSNIHFDCSSPTSLKSEEMSKSTCSLPQRALSKSHLRQPQLKKQASCIAFPQLVQKDHLQQSFQTQNPFKLHKSWPLEPKSSRPHLRDRANTTPQQPTDSITPSNLSISTSFDDVHSKRLEYNSSPDYNDHLYMRSPPLTPLKSSFSSTLSTRTSFTHGSTLPEVIEEDISAYISTQSYFFHDDDDGSEERSWIERQRAKFRYYTDPSVLPPLSDPPRLTPLRELHQRSDSYISSSFQKASKPKKKKPSLGKQAKEFFSSTLTSRKSSAKLSSSFREHDTMDTPPPTPPFSAPPLVLMQKRKEKKGVCKTCPKCDWGALQKREECDGEMLVTCYCRADLCFGCLRDWDFCEGTCAR